MIKYCSAASTYRGHKPPRAVCVLYVTLELRINIDSYDFFMYLVNNDQLIVFGTFFR
jgi:hypothetical protein